MKRMYMDSSTNTLALAFIEDNTKVLWETRLEGRKSHAEAIARLIKSGLEATNLKVCDFDSFVVGIGPGSYTGLRVALAICKMFAWSLSKPLSTVSSLDLVASKALSKPGTYIITESAKTDYVYGKVLVSDGSTYYTLIDETYASVAEWSALIAGIKGVKLTEAEFAFDFTMPLHETVVKDLHDLTPNYLRKEVIG